MSETQTQDTMPKKDRSPHVVVRLTQPKDLPQIAAISQQIYPAGPWGLDQLQSHLRVFPEGQLVAEDTRTGKVAGMAASLIILWDDYDIQGHWKDFTDHGYFKNHDPQHGHTLYGAEVMVDPSTQGMGVGKKIYAARRELCRRLGLLRIRAGARLADYHKYADTLAPEEYVIKVVNGEMGDPTLSFQLKQGFRVLDVVRDYVPHDSGSRGAAAVIEWINHTIAQRRDYWRRDARFARHRKR